jgi:hypothetical protein
LRRVVGRLAADVGDVDRVGSVRSVEIRGRPTHGDLKPEMAGSKDIDAAFETDALLFLERQCLTAAARELAGGQ